MRHDSHKLVWILLLNLVEGRFEVVGHLTCLLLSGFIVDFPKRIKHDKIDKLRESHPFRSCEVSILNSEPSNLKGVRLKISVSRRDVIVISRAEDDRPVSRHSLKLTHEPVVLHPIKILKVVSHVASDY
jgi:hypothetical protein